MPLVAGSCLPDAIPPENRKNLAGISATSSPTSMFTPVHTFNMYVCIYIYILLYYIILYYIILYYIVLYYIILYYTLCCAFHNPFWPGVHPMQCTVHSHTHCYFFCRSNVTFIAMFDSGSYIVLYYIVLYYITLYYIILYYIYALYVATVYMMNICIYIY